MPLDVFYYILLIMLIQFAQQNLFSSVIAGKLYLALVYSKIKQIFVRPEIKEILEKQI